MLTPFSNLIPFALLDGLVIAAAASWLVLAIRDFRTRKGGSAWRAAGRVVVRTLTWTAGLYLLFLVLWGFNYRRVKLSDRVPFDAASVTPRALHDLAVRTVARMNALHDPAHAIGWPRGDTIDPSLAAAFEGAARDVRGGLVAVARPKRSLLDWYFRRASVDGMTDPFFLETLVNGDLLPFERPFVVAHEWSHLAGLADEGEANFLGWLACTRAAPPDAYSAWLFLYGEIAAALPRRERAEVLAQLDSGPRADLAAIADRVARSASPIVAAAGWRVYDQYLKANRVESGARSYTEVIRLILGIKLKAASGS
jgi:hypothetical protein